MTDRTLLLRRGFIVGLAVFIVGMVSIAGYTLWRLRAEAIANGLEVSAMQSRGYEDFLTQSLHAAELTVVNAAPEDHPLDAGTLQKQFALALRHTPFIRSISLLDDTGRIVVSSNRANVGMTVRNDAFLPATEGKLEILRVGQPWTGRDFADGKPTASPVDAQGQSFIPLTRTLTWGGRAATVLMAFNSDYFLNHVAQSLDPQEGWVEVLRYDGVVLLDSRANPQTGELHDYAVRELLLADAELGSFEQDYVQTGQVLTAYRASHLYPWVVFTHRQRDFALTRWRSEARTLVGGLLPVLLIISLLALAFYRRQLQMIKQQAEAARQHRINAAEQKLAQERIAELNRDFVAFLENTSDFIYFKDEHSRFRFCSQTLANITGHASWRELIGKHDLEVFTRELAQIYYKEELPIFAEGKPLLNKVDPYVDANGKPGWVSTNKWPVLDPQGKVVGLFGIGRDITERMAAEKKLKLAASVFANSREAIMITATDGAIVDANDAFTRITGYDKEEVVGKNPRILKSGRQGREHYTAMWRSLIDKGHWYGEIWNRRKNGEVFAEMQTISSVHDEQGVVQYYVSLFSDITPVKVHQQQLEHIAHFDALTNLPNRVLLADRLRQAMTQAQRRGQLLAVVFLDLDGFKRINDHHGHEAGDQLLITLAERMRQSLREVDTLARIGGDEFVAVLADLSEAAMTVPMISRLLMAAAQPMVFGDVMLQVSASLGVTFYPQADEVDADQLLRQADQAMYQAKLAGKNRYHVFDSEQDRCVRGHHEHLENVRHAIAAHEFELYYQPKVNMRTGVVVGAEALIRWQHPEHGMLLPASFLPVIEDHPLAVELGEWVIDTALSQMEQWHAAGLVMPVSVNVGARQLQQSDFVLRLRKALDAHPSIPPAFLELEVLETSALEDMNGVSRVMDACRDMGVSFALDDFGTGYSSLTYLKRLPARLLKIDQSFVCNMLDDPQDLAILEGVMGLASAFGREVIAEGVETIAQGTMLLQLGCDLAQGFGIARPMPAQAIPGWVASWRPDAAWGQQP